MHLKPEPLNIHRQLANEYSLYALGVSCSISDYRAIVVRKDLPISVRRRAIKVLRTRYAELISLAEQVEHHLTDAFEYEIQPD